MRKAAAAASWNGDYPYMVARMEFDRGDHATARRQFEENLREHPAHAGTANDLAFQIGRAHV